MDSHDLAKTGFTLIRGLLEGRIQGGSVAALDLAEALHNLPDPGNTFLVELTLRNLTKVAARHPQLRASLAAVAPLPE